MYWINLHQVFQTIVHYLQSIFWTMCDNMRDNPKVAKFEMFTFKPFKYEVIKPSQKNKFPFPRSGHRIGADSSNFYSFGGYNPLSPREEDHDEADEFLIHTYPLFQELWRFNFASRKWYRYPNKSSLPIELASNALVLHRNLLMVYGGTGSPFGYRCSNQLYICRVNESNGEMAEISATGQFPLPLYGQAVIYHNDYLYTIGGTTGVKFTCDIHRLNLKTYEWEAIFLSTGVHRYEPAGRYRHEVGFDGKNIYILGGGTAEMAYDFSSIPTFNLEKLEWLEKKSKKDPNEGIPAARRCHGAVQINSGDAIQVFIMGGHDGENMFNDLWKLDLSTLQWTNFSSCLLPKPIYFHAAAASPEGKLYVFGGLTSGEETPIRTNTIYTTWLCIPKLSELCWEALIMYHPHIVNTESNDLINIGLPRHFVRRLCNK